MRLPGKSCLKSAAFILALGLCGRAQESGPRLAFADQVALVSCDAASAVPIPVFRAKFNIVDSKGSPTPVQLPPDEALAPNISITVNGRQLKPFYAAAQRESTLEQHRVALFLVDVSGSMTDKLTSGQTRFEAAKAALFSSLDKFQAGVDEVAVVSFESHGVDARIGQVRFATTKTEAMNQVNALPDPQKKNNTALYSAVVDGLDILDRRRTPGSGSRDAESMLIVMTDGKNDILAGDDPGLLAGPAGLAFAAKKVGQSKSQVIGVGFGKASEIDETALGQISTRKFMAQDQAGLSQIFDFARVLLHSRIVVSFFSPLWPDRSSLAGTNLDISAVLKLASGVSLSSGHQVWTTPQIGIPSFAGSCGQDESLALFHQDTAGGSDWMPILRPVMLFIGLGTLLIVLWFWVPRLVWADQYVGVVPVPQRWANGPSGSGSRDRNAPAGFGLTKGPSRPPRAPSDATIVQPRPDFTKTRLDRDKY